MPSTSCPAWPPTAPSSTRLGRQIDSATGGAWMTPESAGRCRVSPQHYCRSSLSAIGGRPIQLLYWVTYPTELCEDEICVSRRCASEIKRWERAYERRIRR